MVARQGFEPRLKESESFVLPLHNRAGKEGDTGNLPISLQVIFSENFLEKPQNGSGGSFAGGLTNRVSISLVMNSNASSTVVTTLTSFRSSGLIVPYSTIASRLSTLLQNSFPYSMIGML